MSQRTTLRMADGVAHESPVSAPAGRAPLTILLSAYACEPGKGSEPGIGWYWAVNLAAMGHSVWVLTRANNCAVIETALASETRKNLHFVYYDLPLWMRWWKRRRHGVQLYYLFWQWGAYRVARKLCTQMRFDVIHHITFGVFRHPSFLAFLGVPFVFGPVGGGEAAPLSLRSTFHWRGRIADRLRDFANWTVYINPLMRAVFRNTAVTLCKTAETLQKIPPPYRSRCMIQLELATESTAGAVVHRLRPAGSGLRVLYVGRLVYWKGLHLGLMAFAQLLRSEQHATLTVIGAGRDERWLRTLARDLGVEDAVTWRGRLDHLAVISAYSDHDVLLFPSLHDSSGNVVLEALRAGIPVVCIDTGGPGAIVDRSCGLKIPVGHVHDVVSGLCWALQRLAQEPPLAARLSAGAIARADGEFSWASRMASVEAVYRALLTTSAEAKTA
ncbi:MAG TPA: glycosyltransferase family 4 protein [Burkholderiales bacterium]|nr:glycosyltransferase family 4 protein [Burkholderiales bacterium]